MTKYNLEIQTDGREAQGYEDRFHWVNYGMITAEGSSLKELLNSATIELIDQDGGTADTVEAEESWMQELVKKEFKLLQRQDFASTHGADFVDNFDEEFDIETPQEQALVKQNPLRQRLFVLLSSRYAFYVAGLLDGILILLALHYLLTK